MTGRSFRPWVVGSLLVAGCTGTIGGDESGGPGGDLPRSTPTDFVCNPNLVPETLPARRLSERQYRNSVEALVRFALPSQAEEAVVSVAGSLDLVVPDALTGEDLHYARFSRRDQGVAQDHADAYHDVGVAVGLALTETDAALGESVGPCATDGDASNDEDCLAEFIRRFGGRALRRPITADDVAFYRRVAAPAAPVVREDYADVLTVLLNSPYFLYFSEYGYPASEAPQERLGAYAIASRLSYHFWQTLPDEALLAAAADGSLLTDEGYEEQLRRVFQDPRTRDSLREFFGQWLDNTTLEELDVRIGVSAYDTIRGELTPSPDLRNAMRDEVIDAAVYYTLDQPGTFQDFFRSDLSFARSEELAAIYGVVPWDGVSAPPALNDRSGLLSRGMFVATGTTNTRPIMKGVLIRKAILCDTVQPAPPDAPTEVDLQPGMSNAERIEELTGSGSCATCHVMINGLGFVSEDFDPLGRSRTEERLVDATTGEVIESVAISTTAIPRVELADETEVRGIDGLTEQMLASDKPYACFARRYLQFTFGRIEDLDRDACALEGVMEFA
ncbi:MAG: DUF1592 domain-containing protein, partial [Myxococcota bacterium]